MCRWIVLLFTLCLGTFARAADSSGRALELVVRGGDTLIAISDRYLAKPADWPKLQRLNQVANPRRLRPGSTIRIPFAWLREEAGQAEVVSVAGASVTVDAAPAAAGARLRPGAVVRTGADSHAALRTHDGSLIALQARSEARIASLGKFVNTDIFVGPFTAAQRFVVINRVRDSGGANLSTGDGSPVLLQ